MAIVLHPLLVDVETSAGQVSAQSLAATVTVNVQFPELFEASVAVQVTVVVPVGKLDPDGGLQETTRSFDGVQLSVAGGVKKVTLAAPDPAGSSGVAISAGQTMVGGVASEPVTTTLKLQAPPPAVLQLTTVVPIGNAELEGGLQTIGSAPQPPEAVGAEYVTTAEHALPVAASLTSPEHVSVQTFPAPTTVLEVLEVLSDGCSSSVLLDMLAALVMTVPSATPAFTLKVNEKTAMAPTASVFIVQLIEPLPLPLDGVVHVKAGPESCASDTKVVLAGTESVRVTDCASSGPRLITSTL